MSLDRYGPKPLHQQLDEILRSKIEGGEFAPDQAIPSENELSRQYNLSRMTVRNVITRMVAEGLLYRVMGKGTFVSRQKITTAPITRMGIREQLEIMGYQTGTVVVDRHIEKAEGKIADRLRISEGEQVYFLERLRYANGEPLSLHFTYIPVRLCDDLFEKDIEKMALCDILEKEYDIRAKRGEETLESTVTDASESKLLEVKRNFHMLLLHYVMYSQNDIPFEYSKVLFRGDRIKLKFEFDR